MTDTDKLIEPFVSPARAQTMLRDFEAHRKAVRSGDFAAIDQTWDRCERWVDQLRPDTADTIAAQQKHIAALRAQLDRALDAISSIADQSKSNELPDGALESIPAEKEWHAGYDAAIDSARRIRAALANTGGEG